MLLAVVPETPWKTPDLLGAPFLGMPAMQPFDNGVFDRRFKETFNPAIEAAGFEAYRVDKERRYELGYAFARYRPVAMICSNERDGGYPLDVLHRTVISYQAGCAGGFTYLASKITTKLRAFQNR